MDLSDLLQKHLKTRVRVTDIILDGREHTAEDFIDKQIEPIYDAETLTEVIEKISEAQDRLKAFDIFKSVEADIVPSPNGQRDSVVVNMKLKEEKRFEGSVGTFLRKNEGGAEAALTLRNIFGRGEKLTFSAEAQEPLGTEFSTGGLKKALLGSLPTLASNVSKRITTGTPAKNMHYNLNFSVPFFLGSDTGMKVRAFQSTDDLILRSSYVESSKGGEVTFLPRSMPGHSFKIGASLRDILPSTEDDTESTSNASVSILGEPRSSVKSFLAHSFVRESRDSEVAPLEGDYVKADTELAGIGGDVKYIKHETTYQTNFKLMDISDEEKDCVALHLGAAGGLVLPLAYDNTRVNDRFFVGGGMRLRGFRTNRVGPQSARPSGDAIDALGGDVYGILSASISAPCPIEVLKKVLGARMHAFVNIGNNERMPSGTSVASWGKAFINEARIAAGLGLVLPTRFGRVELNACLPIKVKEERGDRLKNFQIGVGMDFL
eukprot:CAMPEP_0113880374 /NCGR_PEP_ID=MMETSP0780_2-20120614/7748_1 /TAXON_ID=652834 /ORGANISM="Palpitomonas bilix" /LENGTH=490 /DNA_ID=CAMNT_0000867039 /DNA_START=49 /DNA_END=1521 /DNA_ORIENTATION=+ /assembly_acc=CAM_ASM_000599